MPGLVGRGPFRGAFDARAWPLPISTAAPAEQGHCACAGGLRRGAQSVRPRPMPAARGRNVRAVAKAQPQCQADSRSWVRREVCDHGPVGAPGEGRYHWTVTVFGETDPVAGRTGELGKARSQAEGALLAYVEGGNDGPWALSWRLCRFLPTVGMRELLTQRDGHLCYGFVVQCRDRGRVRTDNDNGYIAPFSLAWVSETR